MASYFQDSSQTRQTQLSLVSASQWGKLTGDSATGLFFPPKTNRVSSFSFLPATPHTGQSDKGLWGWRDGGKVRMGTDLPTEGAAGFIRSSVPWFAPTFISSNFYDPPEHSSILWSTQTFIWSMSMIYPNIHLVYDLPIYWLHSLILWSTHLSALWSTKTVIWSMIYPNIHWFYDLPKHVLYEVWSTPTFIGSMIYPDIHLPKHSSVLWSTQSSVLWSTQTFIWSMIYPNVHQFYDLPKHAIVLWFTQTPTAASVLRSTHSPTPTFIGSMVGSMIYPNTHIVIRLQARGREGWALRLKLDPGQRLKPAVKANTWL